jgi:hypothetical protein
MTAVLPHVQGWKLESKVVLTSLRTMFVSSFPVDLDKMQPHIWQVESNRLEMVCEVIVSLGH